MNAALVKVMSPVGGVVLLLLLGACGGGGSPSREEFADEYCELLKPCCAQAGQGTGVTNCKLWTAYVKVDAATYNPDRAGACLSKLRGRKPGADACAGLLTEETCRTILNPSRALRALRCSATIVNATRSAPLPKRVPWCARET